MVVSNDFAICPWCGAEDSTWPEYHNKAVNVRSNLTCGACGKPFLVIETTEFRKVPVCAHDRAALGDFIRLPVCVFETRKVV